MIADIPHPATQKTDAVSAILPFCSHDNDVLRCAAIRALAAQDAQGTGIREALLKAILDEDPDVRSDAMEALAAHALPGDAPDLRASLEGDPVREVKLAAIHTLANLKDDTSARLLRDLMQSRCEGRVHWEDQLGDWEDWLDIQTACIQALGKMGATEAIDDMFAAMADEFGQNLDTQVFAALADMGSDGVPWLLAQIEVGDALSRKRAAQALVRVAPDAILEYADVIVSSADTQIRLLGMSVLPDTDTRLSALFQDTDPAIRSAALMRLAGDHPSLVHQALADNSPQVQATALACLDLPVPANLHAPLVDNALAWLQSANTDLAGAAAALLPMLAPDRCETPLIELAANPHRPLDLRVAAVRALAHRHVPNRLTHLTALLSSAAQQVRVAALHGLRSMADDGDGEAIGILAQAIAGSVLPPRDRLQKRPPEEAADLTAPRDEEDRARANRVRITADGDIVPDTAEAADTASSTVASIQSELSADPPVSPAQDKAAPDGQSGKKRKRRAVEGPETVADDLSRVAMTIAADLPDARLETAILSRLDDTDNGLRTTAWEQLARLAEDGRAGPQARTAALSALEETDPVIRFAAFRILCAHGATADIQARALVDEDALIRAAAVAMLPPGAALDHVTDQASAVRESALGNVLKAPDGPTVIAAVDRLLQSDHIATLSELLSRSPIAGEHAARVLTSAMPARNALVLLEAFARAQAG